MAQNIYDDRKFFEGYSQLPRSVDGLSAAPEWPALRAMLPAMQGLRVVDLGCGFGWFCRWARENGAAEILGVDLSENMLERARATTSDAAITFARADLDEIVLPEAAFDLAYSSLALHYLVDAAAFFKKIRAGLRPGSRFVFFMEHPIYTAPRRPGWIEVEGAHVWPLDNYLAEGPRRTDWLAKGVVKQHRTVATIINLLIGAGFRIRHVQGWGPTEAQIADKPILAQERERPPFLLLSAERAD